MKKLISSLLLIVITLYSSCKKEEQEIIPEIEVCKWLNDSPCFLNLSFDDSQIAHFLIANLLDEYGFKGNFFLNSEDISYDLVDKYKSILYSGHEIGNHTAHHLDLTKLSEEEILYEINSCQTFLDSTFNINCTIFAHPVHASNTFGNNIIFSLNLFTRNCSEYFSSTRPKYYLNSDAVFNDMVTFIDTQIANNNSCLFCGHGFDNMGYSPCTKELLIELLEYIKKVQNDKKVWVTTMSQGALYESLFYEVKITSNIDMSHQQINIKFDCPDKAIYNKFNRLLYSFKIKKSSSWSIQNNGIEYIESDTHYIFTIDLKQIKELTLHYSLVG